MGLILQPSRSIGVEYVQGSLAESSVSEWDPSELVS